MAREGVRGENKKGGLRREAVATFILIFSGYYSMALPEELSDHAFDFATRKSRGRN